MKKIFLLLLFLSSLAFSKVYPTGLLIDSNAYNNIPITAMLTRGSVTLPLSFSLESYTPNVGNQGQTGTCVAWATAYGARTILEAISKIEKTRQQILKMYSLLLIFTIKYD